MRRCLIVFAVYKMLSGIMEYAGGTILGSHWDSKDTLTVGVGVISEALSNYQIQSNKMPQGSPGTAGKQCWEWRRPEYFAA